MKKLFVFLMLGLFMISFASAWSFDDVENYNAKTKTLTINDCNLWTGICLIKGEELMSATLTSPEINKVLPGINTLVGEFTVTYKGDIKELIGGLNLINLNNGKVMDKNQEYKYKKYSYENITEYGLDCKERENLNGTYLDCNQIESGYHLIKSFEWETLDAREEKFISGEEYEIGIFVDTEIGDRGDWIPELKGKQIEQWAEYTVEANCAAGGDVILDGDYCVNTFTSNGTFEAPNTQSIPNATVLIVAGGGVGGYARGGGGGAGGLIYNTSYNAVGDITVVVGDGGIAAVSNVYGTNATNSSFGDLKAHFGGQGSSSDAGASQALIGGSGGGAANSGESVGGGIAGQGYAGGLATTPTPFNAGGGGGAGAVGEAGDGVSAGDGGTGFTTSINGTSICYAGGGGGASNGATSGSATCGGGEGGIHSSTLPTAGVDGLGGGSGGNVYSTGADGGDGVVIVRYLAYSILITLNSNTYNATTFDTALEIFAANITANASLTNVYLNYNETVYELTNYSGIWNTSFEIPVDNPGYKTLNYIYTYDGVNISSSNFYQSVTALTFVLCGTGDTVANFTFANENNQSVINGSMPSATFQYWLGSGTVNNSLTISNSTEAPAYLFCSNVGTRTLNVDYRIQYESTGHPQRIADPPTLVFTNSSITNKTLYLLPTADGIYVTFQVINIADQVISGVKVNATRLIGASQELVGEGTTDASGSVTMWLNPNFVHAFVFSKTAQTTVSTSFAPTQSGYTITLGSSSSTSTTDYTKGITSIVKPAVSLKSLYYNSIYKTNWTLATSIYLITEFGFNLTGDNGVQIGTVSSSNNGGLVGLTFNTSQNNSITMDRWYIINNTMHTHTQYWAVISGEGSNHSINNFFTDLDNYVDTGMFGLATFGFKLIVFFGMFIFIGVMSFKYGLQNEGILSILVFGVVFWVDYGLDLIPTVVGMPYFPTFIVGLITLGVLTRGWRT